MPMRIRTVRVCAGEPARGDDAMAMGTHQQSQAVPFQRGRGQLIRSTLPVKRSLDRLSVARRLSGPKSRNWTSAGGSLAVTSTEVIIIDQVTPLRTLSRPVAAMPPTDLALVTESYD